jgi:hypothetical protein
MTLKQKLKGTTLLVLGLIGTNYYSMMLPTACQYAIEHRQPYIQRQNELRLSLSSGLLSFVLGTNLLLTCKPNPSREKQNKNTKT